MRMGCTGVCWATICRSMVDLLCWHGRADAETPGLVRSSADDRAIAPPGDDHGLAPQLRIIALLDRRIKRIHVDVDNFL